MSSNQADSTTDRMVGTVNPVGRPLAMTRLVAAMVNYIAACGVSIAEIKATTGLNRTDLIDSESRLPEEVIPKLWKLVGETTSSQSPAIHMVSGSSTSVLGPCEQLVRHAQNLDVAIDAAVRFGSVVSDQAQLRRRDSETTTAIQLRHPLDEHDCGNAAEVGVGLLFKLITECQGVNLLVGVDFVHQPLAPVSSYEDFFGVPVRFGHEWNSLHFRGEALVSPMKDADERLFKYVQSNLELIEDRWLLPGSRNLVSRIYAVARTNAEKGVFCVEHLAVSLGVSLRKLQRDAKAHGLTVSAVLEEAREARAKRLLRETDFTLDDVAEKLGYCDSRAFRRAFRRWTTQTPSEHRKSFSSIRSDPDYV